MIALLAALVVVLLAGLLGSLVLLGMAARENRERRDAIAAHPAVAQHLAAFEEQLRTAQAEADRVQTELRRERARFTGPSTDDERRFSLRVQSEVRTRQYRDGGG